MSSVDDRTTRARIRDSALARFARDGVPATTLRGVAADAAVSVGLVAHHFGSKEGLRREVDTYVIVLVRDWLERTTEGSASLIGTMLEEALTSVDVVRYLSRALVDGTAEAGTLFDELVSLTETMLAEGERDGWVQATADPRMRATLLTTWDLGVLALADHVSRAAGSSVFGREGMSRWSRVVLEVYSRGLLTDERWLHELDAAALRTPPGTTHTGAEGGAPGNQLPSDDQDPPTEGGP